VGDFARRLARVRVPIGFLCAGVVLWLAEPTGRSLLSGGGVAAIGEALRIWAAGHLNKSREVTSSGPYRWLAHPLYMGSSILGVGLAIAAANWIVTVLIACYLLTTMMAAIRSEEAFLRGKFGDRYDRYRRGSSPEGAAAAEGGRSRRFSVAQALANHEHRAVVGLAFAVLLLALKATYNGSLWGTGAGHQ
jgi:Phospholipid methyltransferase